MKKRGRKPKKEKKVLKKRGRKPKGGKIVKKNFIANIEKNIVIPNIVLHLKCNTKDIKNNISNFYYDPRIENTEAYTITNANKKALLSFKTINDNQKKTGKKNEMSDIKIIWCKLKELRKKLKNNNVSNKKSDCFWCSHPFDTPPFYIPKNEKKTIEVYGCFCSAECAVAFLMEENIDSSITWERYALLNNMYREILNYKKNIKPAPSPYYILDKYYGNLTIEEYRKVLKKDNLLIIIDKPLTKIFPELHDDTNETPNIYSNLLNDNNNKNYTYRLKSNLPKAKKNIMMKENFNFT